MNNVTSMYINSRITTSYWIVHWGLFPGEYHFSWSQRSNTAWALWADIPWAFPFPHYWVHFCHYSELFRQPHYWEFMVISFLRFLGDKISQKINIPVFLSLTIFCLPFFNDHWDLGKQLSCTCTRWDWTPCDSCPLHFDQCGFLW